MAVWNEVLADFNSLDESINFGTRAFAESDDCIYETSTLATIQPNSEVKDYPSVLSVSLPGDKTCVAVGVCLIGLSVNTTVDVLFSQVYNSEISALCPSSDSRFVFIGLQKGSVVCIHIPTLKNVFSWTSAELFSKPSKIVGVICHQKHVLIFNSTGCICRVSGIKFDDVHEALSADQAVEELTSGILFEEIASGCSVKPLLSVAYNGTSDATVAVGRGFAAWSEEWDEFYLSKSNLSLKKVHFYSSGQLALALTDKGDILQICPHTMTTKFVELSDTLQDFLVVSTNGVERVLAISLPKADADSTLLMFCLPGFEVKLRLKIGSRAQVVSLGDAEDIVYLEFMVEEDEDLITGLAVKAAVQTNPKIRLDRLLTRRKFEAARSLAETFGLDLTPIHKTMAQNVIESLQPWGSSSKPSDSEIDSLYAKLMTQLDKISDLDFVCQCCVEAISSDLDILRNLLHYATTRIAAFMINNPEEGTKVIEWSKRAGRALHRLDTFSLTEPTWDVERWIEFSQSHPMKEVEKRLKLGKVDEAMIIWNRHLWECKQLFCLSGRQYFQLVEIIPGWVPLDELIIWLKQLLPLVLLEQQSAALKMIELITPKIKTLENLRGSEWPDIGLQYANSILSFVNKEYTKNSCVGMQSVTMRPLVLLIDALKDLSFLKNTFGLFISLSEYQEGEPEEVGCTLLNKVNEKTLLEFIDKFLTSFVAQRQQNLDAVLLSYIKRVLLCSPGWWFWDEAPWEARLTTLIPRIVNCEMRFECIMRVLEEAPVPWTPIIMKTADDAAALDHPLASKITEKRRQIAANMIAKKYKIKTAISKISKGRLLRLIIQKNLPSLSEDVEQVVNSTEFDVFDNLIRTSILAFIYERKLDHVSATLSKLNAETLASFCIALTQIELPASELDGTDGFSLKVGLLSILEQHLRKAQSEDVPCSEAIAHVRYFRDFLVMKAEYPSLVEASNGKTKKDAFFESVDKLLSEEKKDSPVHLIKCLASIFQLPEQDSFVNVAISFVTSNKIELALAVAREVTQWSMVDPDLCNGLNILARTLLANSASDGNIEYSQRMVRMAYAVSQLSCLSAQGNFLDEANRLAGWARTCVGVSKGDISVSEDLDNLDTGLLIRTSDSIQKKIFSFVYTDPGLCGFSNVNSQSVCKCLELSGENGDFSNVLSLLDSCLQQLLKNQRDLAALRLLCQVHSLLAADPIKRAGIAETTSKVAAELLAKVVNNRRVDTELSVCLLSYLGKKQAMTFLSDRLDRFQMDLKKQAAVAKLGITVCGLWQDFTLDNYFRDSLISDTWGILLPKFNISPKELVSSSSPDVLKKLLAAPNVTVDTIKDFCQDYKCSYQAALTLHLKIVLSSWEPGLEIRKQADGQRVPIVLKSEEQLLKRCNKILEHVDNMGPIKSMLIQIWSKINYYYHEVFLVVLQLLQQLEAADSDHTQRHMLLRFLKKYQRRRPPGIDEENSWNDSFSTSNSLPPIAEFRLPYSRPVIAGPTSSILIPEITLQTYSTWLTVATALNFNEDRMRTIAVHQSVTEEFSNQHNVGETWCTSFKYNALYEAVKECLSNVEDLMRASACLYFFTNKIPPGADQLRAAKLCLDYTERLTQTSTENANKLQKVKSKYLNLATTHLLHIYELDDPQYLQLVGSPKNLMITLYQHPAIVDYCSGLRAHCPNINRAVAKIGELHGIDVEYLQWDLILEWLQSDCPLNGDDSMDECTMRPDMIEGGMTDKISSENLMRAKYVMEHGCPESWSHYLQRLAIGSDATENVSVRLRALRCMCMLVDNDVIEKLSGIDKFSVRELHRTLKYIRELEGLGFACSSTAFDNYNKGELAAILLKSQAHRPRALSVIARLCLDYDVEEIGIWRTLLKQLTQLNLHEELDKILPALTKQFQLCTTTEFVEAWNDLVITPFTQANIPPLPEQITAMLSAVEQLKKCPILHKVKTQDAIDACLKMGLYEVAVLMLPFCEKSKKSSTRKAILEAVTSQDLAERLIKTCSVFPFKLSQVLDQLQDPTSVSVRQS